MSSPLIPSSDSVVKELQCIYPPLSFSKLEPGKLDFRVHQQSILVNVYRKSIDPVKFRLFSQKGNEIQMILLGVKKKKNFNFL